ncbi:hypothetical protein Sfulv_03040 [Streptomyces fulvorobeus]|uniref:Carbohydrate kinase PfkB domain-containing protein n=1 Tax=Streptomyces fulvorobeus TaxID=284028 RepID=A0A7J0C0L8_9ACTN|nr:hypothetical protein Sfulv_03040 [Streptomyces fulvorobeus]
MLDRLDVLVIGECVADIVRRPGAVDQVLPGGSPANVAYGLARLGRSATLLTQLGADENGRLIRDHLTAAGVRVRTDDATAPTPSAAVTLDGDGRAAYTFEITWTLAAGGFGTRDALYRYGPPGTAHRHVHTGSIAAVMEPGAGTVRGAVESARTEATVSYDPNVRPELMGDHAAAVRRVERCVALSDIVKASDEDLEWLYPGEDPGKAAARWQATGPALALVTRGPRARSPCFAVDA